MQFFEISLVLFLFITLICMVFTPTKRYLKLFLILSFIVAILQIVLEGIRWQMFPSYLLVLFVPLFWFIKKKYCKILSLVIAFSVLFIAAFLPSFFPVFTFNKPTGKYQIGTITYHFTDSLRNEIFTSQPNQKREIMLQIWYPTNNNFNKDFAPYIENGNTVTNALAELFGYPKLFFKHLKSVKSNAIPNVEISDDKTQYPVLIYLTGVNGSRQFSTFQIQELVSQGYIVAGLDNPGAVVSVCFPDGRTIKGLPIEKIKALIDQSIENLPTIPTLNAIEFKDGIIPYFSNDVSFAINCLEKINENDFQKILTKHLDINKIGLFGVSLGGIVAAEVAVNDNRIKACLIMESPMPKNVIKTGLKIPTMIMTRDEQTMRLERKKSGGWSEKDIQTHQYTMKNIYDRLPSDGYFIKIPKIFHLDFTDAPLWFPYGKYIGLTGEIKSGQVHQIINDFSVAFFDKELKNIPSYFLNHVNEKYSEIIYLQK